MNVPIKLTIVVHAYPPDRRVASRRWGNLVLNLSKTGVDCTIISAGHANLHEYIGVNGERVIRLPICNRSAYTSLRRNEETMFLKNRFKGLLSSFVPPALFDLSLIQWMGQLIFNTKLLEIARESDCIISSYGPLGPFYLGRWLAKISNKPWVVDIRDSFEARDGNACSIVKSWSRRLEGKLLRQANQRITIGKKLAEHLSNTYQIDFSAIYNGWTDNDVLERPQKRNLDEPYLYYAGSIYDHRIPALAIVFEAIQKHPKINLKIRLLSDQTQGSLAMLIDSKININKIQLLPPVDQNIVDEELAESIGALVIEDMANHDALRNGTITGKLMGLLASGLPGIAISSKSGEIRHLVSQVPGWYGVDSVEECQEALDKLLYLPEVEIKPQCLMEFHMSKQADLLLQLIRKTLEYNQ